MPKPIRKPTPKRPPASPKPAKFASIDETFERVVRDRLETLGVSFDTLADASGVQKSTIYRLFASGASTAHVSTIESIATALGVSPRVFWGTR